MMPKDKRYVAFVCSGNTCRSPMAEGIFNYLAALKQLDVEARSFGTATITGLPVSQNSVKVCEEIGVDLSKMTSTSLNEVDVEVYDKFYCMTQSHAEILSYSFSKIPDSKIQVLNISDPYGGDENIYRQCRDEIYNSVKEIIDSYED
jgi:protein-tyrosine-phosphatase